MSVLLVTRHGEFGLALHEEVCSGTSAGHSTKTLYLLRFKTKKTFYSLNSLMPQSL